MHATALAKTLSTLVRRLSKGSYLKPELERLVKEELSGQTAKSYVARIADFHRIQASTMFRQAAEYVRETLHNIGIEDASIEQFTADGLKRYGTRVSPVGWEVKGAVLWLVEPEKGLITRYKDVPTCLHTYSNATPPEGITAELVDVNEGTKPEHYEGKDVKGKFVLATGRARKVHEQSVYKFGAAGVVTDSITYEIKGARESLDIPDAHAYQSIWPTKEELGKVTFGFSISKREGNHLRSLLKAKKKVVLRATVEARLFPGSLDIVTATIQGESRSKQEIFLIAHLCHPKPSANDNASGSGLLIEIARTIKALIASSKLEKPARTIRFIWVPETFGTIAYLLQNEEWVANLVAGINLDMVGQNQELCKSTLNLDRTPDSNPSYLNDYLLNLIERSRDQFDPGSAFGSTSTFRYSANAFSGGSDHAEFNDSTYAVPCIMLLQWPDLYYHTSMDTIDKVSEDSLKRVGWIATVAALNLANASVDEAVYMANLARLGGIERLQVASKEATDSLWALDSGDSEYAAEITQSEATYKAKIEHIVRREKGAIYSVTTLSDRPELDKILSVYADDIDQLGRTEIERFEENLKLVAKAAKIALPVYKKEEKDAGTAKALVPKRLFKGTLDLDFLKKELGEEEYERYERIAEEDKEFRKKTYEIVNFINGERTVYDIVQAVSAEYSRTKPEHVLRLMRDLERSGLVSFQKSHPA